MDALRDSEAKLNTAVTELSSRKEFAKLHLDGLRRQVHESQSTFKQLQEENNGLMTTWINLKAKISALRKEMDAMTPHQANGIFAGEVKEEEEKA